MWNTSVIKYLFNLLLQYTSLSGPSQAILEIMCEAFIGSYCRNSNSEFLCWLGGKFHALCIKFRVTSSVMLSSRNNLIKKFFIILLWLGSVKCEKLDVTTLGKTSYKKFSFGHCPNYLFETLKPLSESESVKIKVKVRKCESLKVKVWKWKWESVKFNRYVKNICMRVIQHSCSVDRQVIGQPWFNSTVMWRTVVCALYFVIVAVDIQEIIII